MTYKDEVIRKNNKLKQILLDGLPSYVTDFIKYIETTKSSNTTLLYTRDIDQYLEFLSENKKNIGVNFFNKLKTTDIKDYERYLSKEIGLSNTSIKRHMSSIASFYKFLNGTDMVNNNPMINYDYPKAETNDIIYLSSDQTQDLLIGIKSNSKKTINVNTGALDKDKKPIFRISIKDKTINEILKTEKFVLRDYAIVMLFLGTGLRVSELVGIDINNINFEDNYVLVYRKGKGSKAKRVYFGEEVKEAIKAYLQGQKLDEGLINKYPKNIIDFCSKNKQKANFLDLAIKEFEIGKENQEQFKKDIFNIAMSLSRLGRNSLGPKANEDALFLSSWGKRLSVRSVQLMVKEVVYCYLPELSNKDKITPHKLRSTAATRMLYQTNDILLVSKQLDHSSPDITSKFYAKLLEDEKKKKVAELSVTDWDQNN